MIPKLTLMAQQLSGILRCEVAIIAVDFEESKDGVSTYTRELGGNFVNAPALEVAAQSMVEWASSALEAKNCDCEVCQASLKRLQACEAILAEGDAYDKKAVH